MTVAANNWGVTNVQNVFIGVDKPNREGNRGVYNFNITSKGLVF